MIEPVFKIRPKEIMHVSKEYVSNGHWLLKKSEIKSPLAPRALRPLLHLQEGKYYDGIKKERTHEIPANIHAVIPHREGYVEILCRQPVRILFEGYQIKSFIFKAKESIGKKNFEIGIDPVYAVLLLMGYCFAKSTNHPILILNGPDLNADLVGVLMPIRI